MVTSWQNLNGPVFLSRLLAGIRASAGSTVEPGEAVLIRAEGSELAMAEPVVSAPAWAKAIVGQAYPSPGVVSIESELEETAGARMGRLPAGPERVRLEFRTSLDSRQLSRLIPVDPEETKLECAHRKAILFVPPPLRSHSCELPSEPVKPRRPEAAIVDPPSTETSVKGVFGNAISEAPLTELESARLYEITQARRMERLQTIAERQLSQKLVGPRLIVPIPSLEAR